VELEAGELCRPTADHNVRQVVLLNFLCEARLAPLGR